MEGFVIIPNLEITDSLLSYQVWLLTDATCLQKLELDADNHMPPVTDHERSPAEGTFRQPQSGLTLQNIDTPEKLGLTVISLY